MFVGWKKKKEKFGPAGPKIGEFTCIFNKIKRNLPFQKRIKNWPRKLENSLVFFNKIKRNRRCILQGEPIAEAWKLCRHSWRNEFILIQKHITTDVKVFHEHFANCFSIVYGPSVPNMRQWWVPMVRAMHAPISIYTFNGPSLHFEKPGSTPWSQRPTLATYLCITIQGTLYIR